MRNFPLNLPKSPQKKNSNGLMNRKSRTRKMPPRAIAQSGYLSGYLMGIAIACAVSFNPLATSTAWSQTKPNTPSIASTAAPQFLAQTSSPAISIAQANSPNETETSNPGTDSDSSNTPSESEPKTGSIPILNPITNPTNRTNWSIILPSLLSPRPNQEIMAVPVRLDGRTIFSVAPLTNNRAEIIENNLKIVLHSNFDPNTLIVYDEIVNGLPVIYVSGEVSGENESKRIYISTVTNLDAEIQGTTTQTVASQWNQEIAQAFQNADAERQPDALKKQAIWAGLVIFIIILSNLTLISIRQQLQKEHENIESKIPPEPTGQNINTNANLSETPENSSENAEAVATLLQERITLLQKRNFNEIKQGLVPFGQGGIFGVGTYIVLGMFPYSRWLQPVIVSILPIPLQLIVTGISTYVAIRVSRMAINRFFAALENRKFKSLGTSERLTLRFSTFSRVFKNLSSGLLITLGTFVGLSVIGINIGPLLAGAGILGLAISLGSQNVIKDTINGFFILLEDQYAVGDVIVVGDVGGLVENMNLRITQLRNGEGRLITIPNSAITVVQNISKEWARVDLTLDLSYQTNADRALAIIQEVVDELYQDSEWQDKIIAPPEVLGIDRMDHAGIMIRVWIKVKPLQHLIVGRECRRRLKNGLDQAGICIGIPQQNVFFNNSLDLLPLKDGN
jgi:moderate conductance mechanosensitive channel